MNHTDSTSATAADGPDPSPSPAAEPDAPAPVRAEPDATAPHPHPERPGAADREAPEAEAPARLSVRRPADLIGLVPYLLGFHPDESVVGVYLSAGRVVLTGRLDLPPRQFAADLVDHLSELGRHHDASEVIVLIYSRRARGRALGQALAGRLRTPGLLEVLLVDGTRWWSLTCGDEQCCPAAGTAYDRGSLPLSAEAVLAGLQALDDRDQLASLVDGPAPADLPALEAGLLRADAEVVELTRAGRRNLAAWLVRQGLAEPATLSDDTCLLLAVLVAGVDVRDDVWLAMDRQQADGYLKLWSRVVARTPPVLAVGPVCLLGIAAWLSGHGALMNCAIARAALLDPDYSLTALLSDLSGAAVAPNWWDDWVHELREAHYLGCSPLGRPRPSIGARNRRSSASTRVCRSRRSGAADTTQDLLQDRDARLH